MYPEKLFREMTYEEAKEMEVLPEDIVNILDDFIDRSNVAYRTAMDFENCSTDEETVEHLKTLISNLKDVIETLEAALEYVEDYIEYCN